MILSLALLLERKGLQRYTLFLNLQIFFEKFLKNSRFSSLFPPQTPLLNESLRDYSAHFGADGAEQRRVHYYIYKESASKKAGWYGKFPEQTGQNAENPRAGASIPVALRGLAIFGLPSGHFPARRRGFLKVWRVGEVFGLLSPRPQFFGGGRGDFRGKTSPKSASEPTFGVVFGPKPHRPLEIFTLWGEKAAKTSPTPCNVRMIFKKIVSGRRVGLYRYFGARANFRAHLQPSVSHWM